MKKGSLHSDSIQNLPIVIIRNSQLIFLRKYKYIVKKYCHWLSTHFFNPYPAMFILRGESPLSQMFCQNHQIHP